MENYVEDSNIYKNNYMCIKFQFRMIPACGQSRARWFGPKVSQKHRYNVNATLLKRLFSFIGLQHVVATWRGNRIPRCLTSRGQNYFSATSLQLTKKWIRRSDVSETYWRLKRFRTCLENLVVPRRPNYSPGDIAKTNKFSWPPVYKIHLISNMLLVYEERNSISFSSCIP
jgi:hypothetical protein